MSTSNRTGPFAAAIKHAENLGHISTLINAIQPAVDIAKNQLGDLLDNAVQANIKLVVDQLSSSIPVVDLVKQDRIKIVGAQYNLHCGMVEVVV